jgi:hypothetical protein
VTKAAVLAINWASVTFLYPVLGLPFCLRAVWEMDGLPGCAICLALTPLVPFALVGGILYTWKDPLTRGAFLTGDEFAWSWAA